MEVVQVVLLLFPAVILHECAHGWAACCLGDPTAKNAGRLTLNPIKHIDPVGTVLLPALLFLSHSGIFFGWAKPVPVNFAALRHPKRDMALVGLAGPLTNIALAVMFSLIFRANVPVGVSEFCKQAVVVNLFLAVFNMVPIPPLDGSRLVLGLLPDSLAYWYSQLESYGIVIVMILLYLGILNQVLLPLVVWGAAALGVH